MPFAAARPGSRRLLRVVGIGVLGLAVGVGATLAVDGLRGRRGPEASVQRLQLPGHGAAADFATAYGLLDRAGQKRYPTLARWTRAQADRDQVTGVRVGSGRRAGDGAVQVTVELTHPAAIDPFAGLVPARTVELWRASQQGGSWRVAADPVSVKPGLPSDDRAPEAVTAWVERLLGCDPEGAVSLQAGAEL